MMHGLDASASTVTVTAIEIAQPPTSITVNARRVEGSNPALRELQLQVGTATDVDLGEGTWEITTPLEDFWAAPVFVTGPEAVTLQLWPRGSIRGTTGTGTPASGDLMISFASSRPSDDKTGPTGSTICPILAREWNCSLPASDLDLRFNLTGFATEFRWGVKITESVDIGKLDFTPGSSVFGKVELRDRTGTDQVRNAEVSVRPINVDRAARRYTATPDARGFFQIRGLAPGDYALSAQWKELVTETRTVQIIAQTNASLKEPLVLAKPARVTVRISPPLDLQQKPWQVTLSARQHGRNVNDVIGTSRASMDGAWSHPRVLPGKYHLTIEQDGGGDWHNEELTLESDEGDHSIDVVLIAQQVRGRILLGERPIAAEIRFGGESGPALIADDDGRFQGAIPPLKDDEATLLVKSETPDVQRTLTLKGERSPDGELSFEITLPATTILGRTVNEDGSPEPSAIVSLRSKDDRLFEQMFSGEDGGFQFAGFEPGMYSLQADSFQKASAVVDVEARTENTSGTDLVLRPQEQIRGRITMRGMPIAGADVYAMPRDTKAAFLPTVTSDASGRFVVTLPPGTRMYDVVVIPRGFTITAARIMKDPKMPDLRVEVGQDGGSLTVDAPDDESMLLLISGGAEYSLAWLAMKTQSAVTKSDGRQRVTIPNLEPGPYSVCRNQKCAAAYVPRLASASITVAQ